ncbi:MAG TPA: serpin family protein [bacterium]|nr:serpin family protein [bacterium]
MSSNQKLFSKRWWVQVWIILGIVTILLSLITCHNLPMEAEQNPHLQLTQTQQKLLHQQNSFGFTLFRELDKHHPGDNLVFSPLSVSMCLGMMLNGAAGETFQAMRQTLGFEELIPGEINTSYRNLLDQIHSADTGVDLHLANALWIDTTFFQGAWQIKENFLNTCQSCFDAEVHELNFHQPEAIEMINHWFTQQTDGELTGTLDEIKGTEVMFITNALYFLARWTHPFDPFVTRKAPFYLQDGGTMQCAMMHALEDFLYYETQTCQIVDLPYGDGYFCMTILLPKAGTSTHTLIDEMTAEQWHHWTDALMDYHVALYVPRFQINQNTSLTDPLSGLGMDIAFDYKQADFSNLCSRCNCMFSISRVLHQTVLRVNEEGTLAASGTIGGYRYIGARDVWDVSMIINRPFVCVIRERSTNTILFLAKVMMPTALAPPGSSAG